MQQILCVIASVCEKGGLCIKIICVKTFSVKKNRATASVCKKQLC